MKNINAHQLSDFLLFVVMLPFQIIWSGAIIMAFSILYLIDEIKSLFKMWVIPYCKGLYDYATNAPINRWKIHQQVVAEVNKVFINNAEKYQQRANRKAEQQTEQFYQHLDETLRIFKF